MEIKFKTMFGVCVPRYATASTIVGPEQTAQSGPGGDHDCDESVDQE